VNSNGLKGMAPRDLPSPGVSGAACASASAIGKGPFCEAVHGVFRRKLVRLAGATDLELDLALFQAARPDHQLVGQTDQVRRGEFGAGAIVRVVIERIEPGSGQLRIGVLAGRILMMPTPKGATLSGQIQPFSS